MVNKHRETALMKLAGDIKAIRIRREAKTRKLIESLLETAKLEGIIDGDDFIQNANMGTVLIITSGGHKHRVQEYYNFEINTTHK